MLTEYRRSRWHHSRLHPASLILQLLHFDCQLRAHAAKINRRDGNAGPANHQYDIAEDFFTAAAAARQLARRKLSEGGGLSGWPAGYSEPLDETNVPGDYDKLLETLPTWNSTAVVIMTDNPMEDGLADGRS